MSFGVRISCHGTKVVVIEIVLVCLTDFVGFPSPALVDLLTDRTDLLGPSHIGEIGSEKTRKKALVPGCGKGYDVLLLAAFGYDAYGLEFSPKALEQAKQHQEASKDQEVYKTRDESEGKGNVTWLSGDFFKDDWVAQVEGHEEGKFDLIYDYTVSVPYNPLSFTDRRSSSPPFIHQCGQHGQLDSSSSCHLMVG